MHIHNVFFWLKKGVTEQEKSDFEKGLAELLKIHLVIKGFWGIPAGVQRKVVDSSYDYSLTMFFKNRQDHDQYQENADHFRFISDHSRLWQEVKVFDTKTDEQDSIDDLIA